MDTPQLQKLIARGAPCECDLCKEHREIDAIKQRGDVEEMRKLIDWLSDALINAEEELSMYRADEYERSIGSR